MPTIEKYETDTVMDMLRGLSRREQDMMELEDRELIRILGHIIAKFVVSGVCDQKRTLCRHFLDIVNNHCFLELKKPQVKQCKHSQQYDRKIDRSLYHNSAVLFFHDHPMKSVSFLNAFVTAPVS